MPKKVLQLDKDTLQRVTANQVTLIKLLVRTAEQVYKKLVTKERDYILVLCIILSRIKQYLKTYKKNNNRYE